MLYNNLQRLVVVFNYLFIKEPKTDIADKDKIYIHSFDSSSSV